MHMDDGTANERLKNGDGQVKPAIATVIAAPRAASCARVYVGSFLKGSLSSLLSTLCSYHAAFITCTHPFVQIYHKSLSLAFTYF